MGFADAFLGARDRAIDRTRMQQEDQNRSALSKLYGDYYSAQPDQRQAIVPEIARRGGDPFALEQASRQQQASMREELVNRAKLLKALPPQHRAVAWQRMAGDVARMVGDDSLAQLPYDPATFDPMIDQLAGAGQDGITVRSSFVGEDGNMYSIMSDGSVKAQGIGADRKLQAFDVPGVGPQVVDLRKATARTVTGEGGPQSYAGQPAPSPRVPLDPGAVQAGLLSLAGDGVVMTSGYRDRAKNVRVGGVAGSQHPEGTAGDFVVPAHMKAAWAQRARELGFEVIDEGDHMHVELPPGAGVVSATQGSQAGAQGDISRVPINQYGGGPVGAPAWVRPSTPAPGQTPPSGYRFDATGNLTPIPGGPHDPNVEKPMTPAQRQKMEQTRRKEEAMLAATSANMDEAVSLIDAILAKKDDFGGVTGIGRLGASIPGTDWADLAADVDRLRGLSAFSALQEMRANSPTGGALGSITERELTLLQNAETALQDSQSPEKLKKSLEDYRQRLLDAKRRLREGVDEFYQDAAPSAPAADDDDALIQQYLR